MAFIERKNPVVLNIKLTSKGRELLAAGQLDFTYYTIGDSEIDYNFNREVVAVDSEYSAFDSTILRPADKNGKIISSIPRNVSGDPYNLVSINPAGYTVENQVESLGFFTDNNTKYITDSNHVKQPDAMINMSGVTGGNSVKLEKAPTYGSSGAEPAVGDILFVKWTGTDGVDSTGVDVNTSTPTPHLFYKITGITSGTLAGAGVIVRLDRELPNFPLGLSNTWAGAMILYNELTFSGDTILNLSSTDYLDESVLSFLENNQCPTIVFPYWNMSIIYTEEIAGVQASNLKYTQFKDRSMGGFVSYIQNQAPTIKKLGVIHYTNSSPANVYGEGFLQDTPTLNIPTIMWHKSTTTTLGTTLSPIGGQKLLAGLDIYYYDLADSQGFVVGKMFPNLKIFVIEDQELLFAMSYKSNRSWTLPDYGATIGIIPPPLPTGPSVTWLMPTVVCNHFAVDCVEYCHADTVGWLPLTASLSLIGVQDTGYRVCTEKVYPLGDESCTRLDSIVVGGTTFCNTCNCCGDFPGLYSTTLTGITNTNSYYFKGVIDEN
jgi:hypothetical protein